MKVTCPADAIRVPAGTSIQAQVKLHPGNTTFCLLAGVHQIAQAIIPKTGNAFVGEYGAILDGTTWTTTDPNQAAFLAHNQDIDDVTIRNLVIRNMPQKAIHAYYVAADRWTIEYNEVSANRRTGIEPGNQSVVRNNYIHHNIGGGYTVYRASGTTFENNDIAYNGGEQKIVQATKVTFRENVVHHNVRDGIWYDADNTDALIEGNHVADNGREGISYEISARGLIRNNTVLRSKSNGIFVSTSRDVQIYDNRLERNFRGIVYFLNCQAVGGGKIGYDLADNSAHDNTVIVDSTTGAYAGGFAYISSCTAKQVASYLSGSKNLTFRNNRYMVPSETVKYWMWGLSGLRSWSSWFGVTPLKSWSEWQALGHDTRGLLSQDRQSR